MVPLRFQYFLNNQVWGWSRCLKCILLETTCMCMFVFAYICLCINSKDILTLNMQCPRNQTSLYYYWIKIWIEEHTIQDIVNWYFLNARYAFKCKARKCYICNRGISLTLLRLLFYIWCSQMIPWMKIYIYIILCITM